MRSLAAAVSDRLPGAHRIRISQFDGVAGNAAAVASEAAETVRFEPSGAIKETVGRTVTVLEDVAVAPTPKADWKRS